MGLGSAWDSCRWAGFLSLHVPPQGVHRQPGSKYGERGPSLLPLFPLSWDEPGPCTPCLEQLWSSPHPQDSRNSRKWEKREKEEEGKAHVSEQGREKKLCVEGVEVESYLFWGLKSPQHLLPQRGLPAMVRGQGGCSHTCTTCCYSHIQLCKILYPFLFPSVGFYNDAKNWSILYSSMIT